VNDRHDYVILVHGTFNAPEAGKPHWCALDGNDNNNFANRLNQRLARTPIGEAVNRRPDGSRTVFSWSAGNSHQERLKGAQKLAGVILDTCAADDRARIHLVAHSHGGNVALKAVEYVYRTLRATAADHMDKLLPVAGGPRVKGVLYLSDLPDDLRAPGKRLLDSRFNHLALFRWLVRPMMNSLLESGLLEGAFGPEETKFWRHCWASSRTNPLATVVFLGTPFFLKRWRKTGPLAWFFRSLGDIAKLAGFWAIPAYTIVFLLLVIPYVVLDHSVPWNPVHWPWPVQALVLCYLGVNVWRGMAHALRFDANVYCSHADFVAAGFADPVRLPSAGNAPVDPRLPALVVTSRTYDEAVLGFSSEPLLFAKLIPVLREFVAPVPSKKHDEIVPAGIARTRRTALQMVKPLSFAAHVAARTLGRPFFLVWRALYRSFAEGPVIRRLFPPLSSLSTGLPQSEYSGAVIEVGHCPGVDSVLRESVVDVSEVLKEPVAQVPRPAPDTDIPEKQGVDSSAAAKGWAAIEPSLDRLSDYYRREDAEEFRADLMENWKAARARLERLGDEITLNHSKYYGNDRIIDLIASFIEHRGLTPDRQAVLDRSRSR
jgi:hypothetical protein